MLGRLRMDVQTCIDKYIELASAAFEPKSRSEILVREMRQAVQDRLDDKDPEAKLLNPDPVCKV